MGVGAEGEACVVVPQHTADRFHVDAVLESYCGEGVPIGYNKDKSGSSLFARVSGFVLILFPVKKGLKWGPGEEGEKRQFI